MIAALSQLIVPGTARACMVARFYAFPDPPRAILADRLQLLHVRVFEFTDSDNAKAYVLEDAQGVRAGQLIEIEASHPCGMWGNVWRPVYVIGYLRHDPTGRPIFSVRAFPRDEPDRPVARDPNLPVYNLPESARPGRSHD